VRPQVCPAIWESWGHGQPSDLRTFQSEVFTQSTIPRRWSNVCGVFARGETVHVMLQIAAGLQHMHKRNLWHRDLKPPNILCLSTASELRVCVADLGLARIETKAGTEATVSSGAGVTPGVVTWPYRAPEVSMGLEYTGAVDLWSLGIIMREMITGCRVWELRECRSDTPLLSAMRVGGIITSDNWPGCQGTAWTCPPTGFKVFTELTDNGGRPVPGKLAQITLSMLQVRPQLRATVSEVFKALQGVRRGHVCRLRLRKKVHPNTPWQACLRSGVVHDGLAASQAITRVAKAGACGLVASQTPTLAGGAIPGDRCTCKGYCRKPGVHCYKDKHVKGTPLCRYLAVPGRTMCQHCQCIHTGCDKGKSMKLETCFKHMRFDPSLKVEIHALGRFEATIVWGNRYACTRAPYAETGDTIISVSITHTDISCMFCR